jgi:hypothetical protein
VPLLLGLCRMPVSLLLHPHGVGEAGLPALLCALLGQGQRLLLLLWLGCLHHCSLQDCCVGHEQLGLQLLLEVLQDVGCCGLQQGLHSSCCHGCVMVCCGSCSWQGP